MLIYKQRYKPRTSREFTKNDLTVYDSAGNTALNALTVYGKSEVVDGAIVSAGEGWATVDLGTLNWASQASAPERYEMITSGLISVAKKPSSNEEKGNIICRAYTTFPRESIYTGSIGISISTSGYICVYDPNYGQNDTSAFKSAMSGVLLCYQLADPTQGNAIAVKTDNGTGIDGTMAVFETGTPLRGIPDTTVRDVMVWDGSSGEVTKNCGEVDLGTLNWIYFTDTHFFVSDSLASVISPPNNNNTPANIVTNASYSVVARNSLSDKKMCINEIGYIIIMNSDYTDATAFKAAMNGVKLVYELATPTTEQLTSTENASIAGLRTFTPQTHAQNNAQTDMTVDYTIRVPTI